MIAKTHSLTDSTRADWLRLIRSDNVGPITFRRLLEQFGTASAALDALPSLTRRGGGARTIKICSRADIESEMEALAEAGAILIAKGEAAYPPLLAHIEDAPPLIAVKGHAHLLVKKAVAVVGSRNASINGQRFARQMAAGLGNGGFLVVSGMARGIDAMAHQGALETGTVAVLGGGVDVIYPKENTDLYNEIAGQGVLISEVAARTQPQARHFPRRNRLISGISRGVVVIEATRRSGSLITARMALEQGREVFAVPGAPGDPRSGGANDLIRQGAQLTETASDVIENLSTASRTPLGESQDIEFKVKKPDTPDASEVEKARQKVISGLGLAPVMVDELIRECQCSPAVVSLVLLELELAGRLERQPGNRVSLIEI